MSSAASTSSFHLNSTSPFNMHPSLPQRDEMSCLSPTSLTGSPRVDHFVRRASVDPSETLAARRFRAAAKARPVPVRRRSQSLELPTKGREEKRPDWLQTAGIKSDVVDYAAFAPIRPILPPSYHSTPVFSTMSTPTTASSIESGILSASSISSTSTFASSIGHSPAYASYPSSATCGSSTGSSTRRVSEPFASASQTRTTSEQQAKTWESLSLTNELPSLPTTVSYSLGKRAVSDSGYSSTVPAPAPLLSPSTIPRSPKRNSISRGFTASVGISSVKSTVPAFPSPLSASHTPEELGEEEEESILWSEGYRPGVQTKRSKGKSKEVGEFPFPPSPVHATFDLPMETPASGESTALPSPRSHPVDLSIPARPNAFRTQSRSTQGTPTPTGFPAAPLPLTPPESTGGGHSRHLTSAADLAWADLGLGQLGIGSYYTAAASGTPGDFLVGPGVQDLMSLDGDTPMTMVPSKPSKDVKGAVGTPASSTPKEGAKKVGQADLMGGTSGGGFGPATRDKLARVMKSLLNDVPLPLGEGIINIVEYGALNSRSSSLIAPIVSQLAHRHTARRLHEGETLDEDDDLYFQITHADSVASDFRALTQQLESHGDSYLNQHWQMKHEPPLSNRVFSNFVSRPFGAKILPKASVSVGFSAMSLHWLSTERKYRTSPTMIAHGEMMAFLSARAFEFAPGGLLSMAFICRSEEEATHPSRVAEGVASALMSTGASRSNPTSPMDAPLPPATRPLMRERSTSSPAVTMARKRDIWAVLTSILGKAIQRLVSTNLLKPAVARQLLALPIHARTPRQTHSALSAMSHAWTIESDATTTLSHPAWRGLAHDTVSRASYTEHTIQLLKVFWESSMRAILREALLSRAACEWVLECLFDIAREKVEEEGPQPLELEVHIIALRRVGHPAGQSTAA